MEQQQQPGWPRLEGWPTVVVMTTISPGSNDRDPVPPSVGNRLCAAFLLSYNGTVTRPQFTVRRLTVPVACAKGRYVYCLGQGESRGKAEEKRRVSLTSPSS